MSLSGNVLGIVTHSGFRKRLGLLCILTSLLMSTAPLLDGFIANADTGEADLIVEIPIHGTIEMGLAPFVQRAIREAEDMAADALLLRVDTFGGRIDAAVRIRDAILHTEIPSVIWVEGRAISAGALITLAGETVIMNEGASIGAAQPVQVTPTGKAKETGEKTVSYMRGEMRATAEARDRDPRIAEAMVDSDIAIDGISEEGKLLTLTSEEALDLDIADHLVSNRKELREIMGWTRAEIRQIEPMWSEQMVRFLTHPILAGLLLSIGGLALLLEIRTPGLGLPGIIGVLALALYFGSHYLVNLAGNVEVLLFLGGLLLIILEVFVIPGFGAAGIIGAILVVLGLLLSRISPHGGSGDIRGALLMLICSFLFTAGVFIALLKYLPEAKWMPGMVLANNQDPNAGFHADQHRDLNLMDKIGHSITDLRPAGTIEVDGSRFDVITMGDYIDVGKTVKIIEVRGNRIVVEEIENNKA
ncbi:MAG: nodulation protein NfeD [bacterium]|nr:nodulation protein NfeD [bacterium]